RGKPCFVSRGSPGSTFAVHYEQTDPVQDYWPDLRHSSLQAAIAKAAALRLAHCEPRHAAVGIRHHLSAGRQRPGDDELAPWHAATIGTHTSSVNRPSSNTTAAQTGR